MPLAGWILFMVGISAAYAAYKDESVVTVILHAINPKASPLSNLNSASPSPGVTGSSFQTTGYAVNASPVAAAAISYAEAQLGKPYQWGGAGPNSFDCSGLTMKAWGAAGKMLPHFSQAQYAVTSGKSLPIVGGNNYPPGCLVFFGSSIATIDHVGLVVGPDQMIEAPHTGDVVKYYSISAESLPLVAVTNPGG